MSKENIANNSFMEVNTIWGLTSIVFMNIVIPMKNCSPIERLVIKLMENHKPWTTFIGGGRGYPDNSPHSCMMLMNLASRTVQFFAFANLMSWLLWAMLAWMVSLHVLWRILICYHAFTKEDKSTSSLPNVPKCGSFKHVPSNLILFGVGSIL